MFPPLGILAWLYLVVLWLTWTPISDAGPRFRWAPYLSWEPLLGNLLLFAPLGFVLAVHWTRTVGSSRRGEIRRVVARVAGTAALLSVAVELGQIRVPGRWVSWWDVVMNSGGAALAAWAASRLVRSGLGPRALIGLAGGLVFVGVLLFTTATGFSASRALTLSEWNPTYTVHGGDEVTGNREYRGSVDEALICTISKEREVCLEPGAGPRERQAMVDQAEEEQAVRLSAVIMPVGSQPVAARIVTFSADSTHRNATLYQEGRSLLLRLRTPIGGPNGTGLEFELPQAVPDGTPTVVMGSFERGRIRIAAGDEAGELRVGMFSGWWLVRPLPENRVDPRALQRAELVAAAAFSLPLGLGAVLLLAWGPILLRLVLAGLAAPMLLVLLASVLNIPFFLWDVMAASGFGWFGGLLGLIGWPVVPAGLGSKRVRASAGVLFAALTAASLPAGLQAQNRAASPFLTPDHWAQGALARLHGAGLLSEGFDPGSPPRGA